MAAASERPERFKETNGMMERGSPGATALASSASVVVVVVAVVVVVDDFL